MRLSIAVGIALIAAASANKYYVMGDWGGKPRAPFTSTAEIKIAQSMAAGVVAHGVDFTLALGDNFYKKGVKNIHDPRFKATFEDVFNGDSLQAPNYAFWLLGGNHDHSGNITAQLEYSNVSPRWKYPALYYTFNSTTRDGATVQFVMIDTVVLAGNTDFHNHTFHGYLGGPADGAAAEEQWIFIEATLSASTADYLIVAGHYPVWSICEDGPTQVLIDRLKPMLEKYKVSAYLAGHDHCAQYIDEGLGVQYHGIGAAHGYDTSMAHANDIPEGSLKFHWATFDPRRIANMTVDDDDILPSHHHLDGAHGVFGVIVADKHSLVVRHLDHEGNVMYVAPRLYPRNMTLSTAPHSQRHT